MKKIMFVIGQLSNGGAERVVSVLANSFAKNFDVSIVTLIDPSIEYCIDSQVRITYIETNTVNKIGRVLKRLSGLKGIIDQFNPDIVISLTTEINIYSIVALFGKKIPLVISERNDPYNDPPSKITRTIRDIVYRWADGYIFQTPDAKSYFDGKINGPWKVIPNPLSGNLPDARNAVKTKKIVTVSRLYEQKNIPLLLNAFAEIHREFPEYVLEIYGDGPLEKELQELANKLDISPYVYFMGFCRDVHDRIQTAELFVLTSDFEGMSNAMLEAIAMGLPTICTDCPIGGARMIIDNHVNGVLVPVNDKASLVNEMMILLKNDEKRHAIANEGYELKEKLSAESIAQEWLTFARTLVETKR